MTNVEANNVLRIDFAVSLMKNDANHPIPQAI